MRKIHRLQGIAKSRQVFLDGKKLDLDTSLDIFDHSPDGFNWGYSGSGPAQLAIAIITTLTGQPFGYQTFKWQILTKLPQGKNFTIKFFLEKDDDGKFLMAEIEGGK